MSTKWCGHPNRDGAGNRPHPAGFFGVGAGAAYAGAGVGINGQFYENGNKLRGDFSQYLP
jgi:hypothetical protein